MSSSLPARRQSEATYVRRRIIAAVVGLLALALAVQVLSALVAAVIPEVPSSGATTLEQAAGESGLAAQAVVVQPGDTLWSIARDLQPTGDVRPLVQRLSELNGGAALEVGQRLVLP